MLHVVRIRSEYFEAESSRYRLAMSQQTIIPSLRLQKFQDFHVVLEMSPMDPLYSARLNAFKDIGAGLLLLEHYQRPPAPFLETTVGDDDFLNANLLAALQQAPAASQNTCLVIPHGYIFYDSKLHVLRNMPNLVDTVQWCHPDRAIEKICEISQLPYWIYVRHGMNRSLLDKSVLFSPEIQGLSWPGWNVNIVKRLAAVRVAEASCFGSTLHPTKSKSVVFATGTRSRRRGRK